MYFPQKPQYLPFGIFLSCHKIYLKKKYNMPNRILYYLPAPNGNPISMGIKIFITNKRHYLNWMHFSFIHISFIVKHFYLINLPKLPQISNWRIHLIYKNMQNENFKGQNWVKYISDILNVNSEIRWNHEIILKLRNVSTNIKTTR